jgi:hypothetical protein
MRISSDNSAGRRRVTQTMASAVNAAILVFALLIVETGCGGSLPRAPQKSPEPPEVAFVRSGCFVDDGISPYGCQADSSLLGGGPRPVGLETIVFYAKAQDNKWGVASVRIEVYAEMHCGAPPNLGADATMSRTIAQDPVNGQPDTRPPSALPRARLVRGDLAVGDFEAHCKNTYGANWSARTMLISVSATAGNGDAQYHQYGPAKYTYRAP